MSKGPSIPHLSEELSQTTCVLYKSFRVLLDSFLNFLFLNHDLWFSLFLPSSGTLGNQTETAGDFVRVCEKSSPPWHI